MSSNKLFPGFPSGVTSNTFFTVLSSDILSTCPNHLNLPFLSSEIISGSLYRFINSWLVRIFHTPFYFIGSNIFLNAFLSHITRVISLLLLKVQASGLYVTTGLTISQLKQGLVTLIMNLHIILMFPFCYFFVCVLCNYLSLLTQKIC